MPFEKIYVKKGGPGKQTTELSKNNKGVSGGGKS